jgi:hypothetical protein
MGVAQPRANATDSPKRGECKQTLVCTNNQRIILTILRKRIVVAFHVYNCDGCVLIERIDWISITAIFTYL